MKSEERHRLKENELEHLANKVRPFFEKYGLILAGGLIAILVLWGGIHLWRSGANKKAAASWAELMKSNSADQFEEAADNYSSTEAGKWARLRQAQSYYNSGFQFSFSNREEAVKDLEKAQSAYVDVLDSNPPSTIRERALYGLGSTLEALAGPKNTKEALEVYKDLLSEFDNSVFKLVVEERIKRLENADVQDFYAWYAEQNPKPSDRERPNDGQSGLNATPAPEIPDLLQMDGTDGDEEFLDTLPETTPPEEKAPEAPGTPEAPGKPGTEEKPEEKTPEKPAENTAPEKPEEKTPEKPAEVPEKPEEKTPETPSTTPPADNKPAPEKPAETTP